MTKKIQRQEKLSPITGPSSVGTPITRITRPMRCGPAVWARIAWPIGMIMPPPKPCSTRKTISDSTLQAMPHNALPSRNSVIDVIHITRPEKRSIAQPVSGITVARASR